jgi:hypothetical protein
MARAASSSSSSGSSWKWFGSTAQHTVQGLHATMHGHGVLLRFWLGLWYFLVNYEQFLPVFVPLTGWI